MRNLKEFAEKLIRNFRKIKKDFQEIFRKFGETPETQVRNFR